METMMSFAENLERGLFALGMLLRLPVMVLLWACVLWVLFQSGAFLADLLKRRQRRQGFDLGAWAAAGGRREDLPRDLRELPEAWALRRASGTATEADLDELLQRHEDKVRGQLIGPRMLTKVGPSLGLLGTLIPMGSSLSQLSSGNLDAMSGQMVVAFTTAIIGLSTGTLAFALSVLRLRWVEQDLRELRYLAERLAAGKEA
jgi:biopolymer transport protein ExbB/TolQ